MPYSIREEDGKYCVYNKDTGENKGCSDSHEKAIQHMRALYAHEPGSKSGPFSIDMTITKAEKTSQGYIRWRGRCNTGEVDSQNERFDSTFWLDLCHNFMRVQKSLSMGEAPPDGLPVPILDVAHYSMTLGPERMKARAGWPVRLWVDGKALMAEGFYDDTPIGKASAAAGMRSEGKRPRISICVYPDWGNVEVQDGTLTYKGGRDVAYLDHLGQTMYPVNIGTDIVAEVNMEKSTTIAQDAAEVLGDEKLAKELEETRKASKSDVAEGAVIKADAPTPAPETPVANDAMATGQPVDKAKREDVSDADKKRAEKEYGDVTYADTENKKYPIDTEEHIRAAWSYIGMPKNAAQYPDNGAAIKAKIVSAWKRVIDKEGPPKAEDKKSQAEPETPAPEVKSEVVAPELAARLDALAQAFGQLATTLQPFMEQTSAQVKSLSERVDALTVSETAKVKSAIDNGGDWLAKFYSPRQAADNKVPADEVKKAEPQQKQLDGIWGFINQKPGG
jgi:hypothetical protein